MIKSAFLARQSTVASCPQGLPRFSVRRSGWRFLFKPEVAGYWRSVHATLVAHPCRTEEDPFVPLVFVGTIAGSLHSLVSLPPRPPGGSYVVLAHGLQLDHCSTQLDDTCQTMQILYQTRGDILYVNLDLRDHVLLRDDVVALPGVTFAPPHFFSGRKPDPSALGTWRWLLTYRGVKRPGWFGASVARLELATAFSLYRDPRVAVEFVPVEHQVTQKDVDRYNELLEGSAFGLIPHGDGRWSYRLSEVMGACVIPVFMANGLTLPYEEVINWPRVSVRVDESLAGNPQMILAQLPQDPGVIQSMRREVCDISSRYFDTTEKRVNAMLMSLAAHAVPVYR